MSKIDNGELATFIMTITGPARCASSDECFTVRALPGEAAHVPLAHLSHESIARAVETAGRGRASEVGVYFGVATRTMGLEKSTQGKKVDCVRLLAVMADLDAKEGGVHQAEELPDTAEEAALLLSELNPPASLVTLTGFGAQAFYVLDPPVECESVRAVESTVKRIAAGLQKQVAPFKLDATSSVQQLARLPGTINAKRPGQPRRARLIRACDTTYSLSELEASLAPLPSTTQTPPPRKAAQQPRAQVERGTSLALVRSALEHKQGYMSDDDAKLMRQLLAGEAFAAPGERDNAMYILASHVVRSKPAWRIPTETLAELFRPSVSAFAAESDANLCVIGEMEKVLDKLTRARDGFDDWLTEQGVEVREPIHRPEITLDGDLAAVITESEKALAEQYGDELYQRGGGLYRVVQSGPDAGHQLLRVGADALREMLASSAAYVQWHGKKDPYLKEVFPPRDIANVIIDRGFWSWARHLVGLASAPIILPSGEVVAAPGYNEAARVFLAPTASFPPIPVSPSPADIQHAKETLLDPLRDFPFAEKSDQAAVIATICAAAGRESIEGTVPGLLVDAPMPGTGKTLLARHVSIAATGQEPFLFSRTRNEEEERKRVFSTVMFDARIALLDNVTSPFGSPTLAATITANELTDRILGISKIARLPHRTVWLVTGNNIALAEDCARRFMSVRIDSQAERPERRTKFKHPNLIATAKQEWPRYVAAALCLLRAYHVAGCPGHGLSVVGSFEAWDKAIRGAMIFHGLGDPASLWDRCQEDGDADREKLVDLLRTWYERFATREMRVAELQSLTANLGDRLRHVLLEVTGRDQYDGHTVGNALKRYKDRPAGGFVLRRLSDAGGGVARWRVEPSRRKS